MVGFDTPIRFTASAGLIHSRFKDIVVAPTATL